MAMNVREAVSVRNGRVKLLIESDAHHDPPDAGVREDREEEINIMQGHYHVQGHKWTD